MWKWTDPKNICAIILDCDSLDDDIIDFHYANIIADVKVFKVTAKASKNNFRNLITYYDLYTLIKEVMKSMGCRSASIISISKNHIFIKSMMQYHIGTIYANDMKREFLEDVPDYIFTNKDKLERILKSQNVGYGAEAYAMNYIKKKHSCSILSCVSNVTMDTCEEKSISLYFGGRYYSKKHNYIYDDPLSVLLLWFKEHESKQIDLFYDSAICRINSKLETFDLVTFTPSKPKDFKEGLSNRFEKLELTHTKEVIEVKPVLECIKDFTQKENDYYSRQATVKNAFRIKENCHIENKHILLLDDLYTTGATVKEIAKVLYKGGARKVSVLLLAVNQTTESSSTPYKKLKCKKCGDNMSLKMGRNGLFFSCDHYYEHVDSMTTLKLSSGMKKLKINNQLEITDENDLDDTY